MIKQTAYCFVQMSTHYLILPLARLRGPTGTRASPRLSDRGPESNILSEYAEPIMDHACRSRLFLQGVAQRVVNAGKGSWLSIGLGSACEVATEEQEQHDGDHRQEHCQATLA